MTNINPGSEVIVFDRSGKRMTSLRAAAHRTWLLNEYGTCTFDIPTSDPKATERNLQFGNLVLVRRAGLPDWGGVIDTPRDWGAKVITVNAYSAEYLLSYRGPGAKGVTLGGSAGANFVKIINMANEPESLNISLGSIDDKGAAREDKIPISNENGLYDSVCEIAESSASEWAILPKLDRASARLSWEAVFVKRRGRDTHFTLNEKPHIAQDSVVLSEQGKIINDLIAAGEGSKAEEGMRYEAKDADSAGVYGLRQGCETYNVKASGQTLAENAENRLLYWKRPRFTVTLTVIDEGAAFAALDIGNTVRVALSTMGYAAAGGFGWTGNVRITGMDYSDDENTVELTAEEISQ